MKVLRPGGSRLEGRGCEAGVSLIFTDSAEPGSGPYLHQHPYAETVIIHGGRARFTVGGEHHDAVAGEVVAVPGFTPHRFEVLGPGRFIATHIHVSDTFVTRWLDGPDTDPIDQND